MTESATAVVVRERISLERRRLARIDSLRTTGPAAELVRQLAGDRLSQMLSNLGQRFDQLERRAARQVDAATLKDLAGLQVAVDRVAAESLDVAMGALARQAGLDAGASGEADLFVEWLASGVDRRFVRPTLPGTEHALHGATDIIHRRVPDYGFWDLAVMAHEFGHLVAGGLRSWDPRDDQVLRPVEDWLSQFDGWERVRQTELFCDVFATFVMGPSYLCSLVFHKMSAVTSSCSGPQDSHPADPSRVYACQWALKRMRGTSALHQFDRQLHRANSSWQQLQGCGEAAARLDTSQQATLNSRLVSCWSTLTMNLSGLRYQPVALTALADALRADDIAGTVAASPADVLNAAWTVRLDDWFDDHKAPRDLESRAKTLLDMTLRGVRR